MREELRQLLLISAKLHASTPSNIISRFKQEDSYNQPVNQYALPDNRALMLLASQAPVDFELQPIMSWNGVGLAIDHFTPLSIMLNPDYQQLTRFQKDNYLWNQLHKDTQ